MVNSDVSLIRYILSETHNITHTNKVARVGWKRHISLRACMNCMHRVCKSYNLVDFARRDAIVAWLRL